jgi:hypothetical protein
MAFTAPGNGALKSGENGTSHIIMILFFLHTILKAVIYLGK